jgi:hypothetical protein
MRSYKRGSTGPSGRWFESQESENRKIPLSDRLTLRRNSLLVRKLSELVQQAARSKSYLAARPCRPLVTIEWALILNIETGWIAGTTQAHRQLVSVALLD